MHLQERSIAFKITLALIVLLSLGGVLYAGNGHYRWFQFKESSYTLPDIELSKFLRHELGLRDIDDHGIDLGGIGSDLFFDRDGRDDRDDGDDYSFWTRDWFRRGPSFGWFKYLGHSNGRHEGRDDGQVYWMITDRGPNGEDPRTFPVPEFTPFILKVKVTDDDIRIQRAIPITGWNVTRDGVTGLPNLKNSTQAALPVLTPALSEKFYNCFGPPSGSNANGLELANNPHGLDTEGLVRTEEGIFWVVEEYGPSILKIAPNGKVLKRFFPRDFLELPANAGELALEPVTGYLTDDSPYAGFPQIYGTRRRLNRGFEGVALSPDEKFIYIALQSPFLTPTGNAGRDSVNTRVLVFDTRLEKVVKEFVYQFNNFNEFNVSNQPTPPLSPNRARDMKLSALAMVDQDHMLVLERTDYIAKIFLVDLRTATNILGTKWDDPLAAAGDSLEAKTLGQLTSDPVTPVTPLAKSLVLTLDSTAPIHGMAIPEKIEGLTILDNRTIAIANDNDFGVAAGALATTFTNTGTACTLNDSGRESQILVIRLDEPVIP